MRHQKNYIISPVCVQQQFAKKFLFSTHPSYFPNSAIIFSKSTLNSRSMRHPSQFIRLILHGNGIPIYQKFSLRAHLLTTRQAGRWYPPYGGCALLPRDVPFRKRKQPCSQKQAEDCEGIIFMLPCCRDK